MSKSLALINGDISIGSNRSLSLVNDRGKLQQDLRLWLLERIGTDLATPGWGSRLDGGIINGQNVSSYIGNITTSNTLNEIRSELISLLQKYQQYQFNKIRDETIRYQGKNTLEENEVLAEINSVDIKQIGTYILAQVDVSTLGGSQVRFVIPVGE